MDLLRVKFNDILEETLVSRKAAYILDIEPAIKSSALYDRSGNLVNDGKIKLWTELDEQIKLFDRQEIHLKPRHVVSNSRNSSHDRIYKKKLPTPPPEKKKINLKDYHSRKSTKHRRSHSDN